MLEAEARAMAEAEAEARAMAEEARLQQLPPPPPPELVAQLLASVAVLLAPPSGQAVADANGWLMRLADTPECWAACLAALQQAADDGTTHALLSLCLSLVRSNKMAGAPPPSALAPMVRRLWAGATEATPARRQACTLLCSLACVDAHECDRLLDWPFSLGTAAEAPLALHVLQDVAFEVFHRPLQSRPLTTLLQEVRSNAVAYLELCASSDSLLLLSLQALQQWLHAGIVLSDLVNMPHLAAGLLRALKVPQVAQLSCEIVVELVGAVELMPERPPAVAWLATRLAADVAPEVLGPTTGAAGFGVGAAPAAAAAPLPPLLERAPCVHALCRVVHALLRHEACALLEPQLAAGTFALAGRLLEVGAGAGGARGSDGGDEGDDPRLLPLWEALLDPPAWRELARRSVEAARGVDPALVAHAYGLLLGATLHRTRLPLSKSELELPSAGADAADLPEETLRWRSTALVAVCGACRDALGDERSCAAVTRALGAAFRSDSLSRATRWLPLEAAVACTAAMVLVQRPRRGGGGAGAATGARLAPCWHTTCDKVFDALLAAGDGLGPPPVVRAALRLAVALAETFGATDDGAEPPPACVGRALAFCVEALRAPPFGSLLARDAAEALLSVCRAAGAAVLRVSSADGGAALWAALTQPLTTAQQQQQPTAAASSEVAEETRVALVAAIGLLATSAVNAPSPSPSASSASAEVAALASRFEQGLAPLMAPWHAAVEEAARGDDADAAEAALRRAAALAGRMLPPLQPSPFSFAAAADEATAPPPAAANASAAASAFAAFARATAKAAAASPATTASEAAAAAVLQLWRTRWLPALRHAAAAGGACAASDDVWAEAASLSLSAAAAAAGVAAWESYEEALLLCAEVFCARGHVACLEAAADAVAALPKGAADAVLARPRLVAALVATLATAARAATEAPSVNGGDGGEMLLAALRLASAALRRGGEGAGAGAAALCAADGALGALWQLLLAGGFGAAAAAGQAECRDAGYALLAQLLKLSSASSPSPASSAAASSAAASAAIVEGLRPHAASLVSHLLSAIAHAAPASAVEPAALLLHGVATACAAEWRAALPAAVDALAAELRAAGRQLSRRAATLLLRAALREPPLPAREFGALWADAAQIVRMGGAEQALERYQPRA